MEGVNQMRYPPHTTEKLRWARVFLLKQVNLARWRQMAQVALLAALAAFVVKVRCFLQTTWVNVVNKHCIIMFPTGYLILGYLGV